MMGRHHIPDTRAEHPNVVPLIDVMLCIIVFYMLAAKIGVATGVDESIQVPATILGSQLREEGSTNTVILNVREVAGAPFVTGVVDSKDGGQLVDIQVEDARTGTRPLAEVLKRLRVGPDGRESTDDDNPGLRVLIRGQAAEPSELDPNPGTLTYKALAPVLIAVAESGVTNIGYMTTDVKRVVE
jgi:hypothetical protein